MYILELYQAQITASGLCGYSLYRDLMGCGRDKACGKLGKSK